MKLMDEVAGIVAIRHCKTSIVTVSVDGMNFHRKIKKGKADTGDRSRYTRINTDLKDHTCLSGLPPLTRDEHYLCIYY